MEFFSLNIDELNAVVLSLKVALLCTGISLPLALLIGYALARYEFAGKALIESFMHLPLVMPPVTTGYLLLLLFGSKGLFGAYLYDYFNIKLAFHFGGAVLAAVVVSFPLMLRSVRTAIEMVDPGYEAASRILGASATKTFFRITIPLAMPGILSGLVLSFARSLGEFGATITFAGNIAGETQTIPLAIYSYMQMPGYEGATLRLAFISVFISLVAMVFSEYFVRRLKKA